MGSRLVAENASIGWSSDRSICRNTRWITRSLTPMKRANRPMTSGVLFGLAIITSWDTGTSGLRTTFEPAVAIAAHMPPKEWPMIACTGPVSATVALIAATYPGSVVVLPFDSPCAGASSAITSKPAVVRGPTQATSRPALEPQPCASRTTGGLPGAPQRQR